MLRGGHFSYELVTDIGREIFLNGSFLIAREAGLDPDWVKTGSCYDRVNPTEG